MCEGVNVLSPGILAGDEYTVAYSVLKVVENSPCVDSKIDVWLVSGGDRVRSGRSRFCGQDSTISLSSVSNCPRFSYVSRNKIFFQVSKWKIQMTSSK